MLASAVALNSIGINIARSIGPAIGGVIVAQLGAVWAFGFNAITFAAMLFVVWGWKRDPKQSSLPPEGFGAGLKAGLRYASRAGRLQAVLIKSVGFFFFAAAMNALLPVVVRGQMQGGAGQYGMLLGCIGMGAVGGALLLPKLRAQMDRDLLVLLATLSLALSLVGLALTRSWRRRHCSWKSAAPDRHCRHRRAAPTNRPGWWPSAGWRRIGCQSACPSHWPHRHAVAGAVACRAGSAAGPPRTGCCCPRPPSAAPARCTRGYQHHRWRSRAARPRRPGC